MKIMMKLKDIKSIISIFGLNKLNYMKQKTKKNNPKRMFLKMKKGLDLNFKKK